MDLLPYFDLPLATEVVENVLKAAGRPHSADRAQAAIDGIHAIGGVEPVYDLLAIPETVQEIVRSGGNSPGREFQRLAASLFVKHASSTMRAPLVSVLGLRASQLLRLSYAVVAEEADSAARQASTADLSHHLFSARGFGRTSDVAAAREVLGRFLDPGDRLLAFIDGVDAWNSGEHAKATSILRAIYSDERRDTIDAMCAQLVGLFEAERRNWQGALDYLVASVQISEELVDERGLSKSLVSLARTTRDQAIAIKDTELGQEAVRLFLRAIDIAERLLPEYGIEARQTLGRAEIGLSRAYRFLGQFTQAIDAADMAVARFDRSTEEWHRAFENLVDVLRSSGRFAKELDLVGLPTRGAVPHGASAVVIANILLPMVQKARAESHGEVLEDSLAADLALQRVREREADMSDQAAAIRALDDALRETEARAQSIMERIAQLSEQIETDPESHGEFITLMDEHRALLARLKAQDPNRHDAFIHRLRAQH
ncbi:hypothetical protein PYV02_07505 [Leifsonia sp. H3M29-4]|uniref:hypothetical protein n=1 Tax=Salinibacterium metalliresistens TaxID=3031321 RepID=UPI0023D988F4|nr:hypothetical protein [Salinibacterium metalliresistens]MDF1478931.1 hypothetical protein [Salinibacterium metalliresistens]